MLSDKDYDLCLSDALAELARLRAECERLKGEAWGRGIHSCSAHCQNPVCKMRRERDEARESLRITEQDADHLDRTLREQLRPVVPNPDAESLNEMVERVVAELVKSREEAINLRIRIAQLEGFQAGADEAAKLNKLGRAGA